MNKEISFRNLRDTVTNLSHKSKMESPDYYPSNNQLNDKLLLLKSNVKHKRKRVFPSPNPHCNSDNDEFEGYSNDDYDDEDSNSSSTSYCSETSTILRKNKIKHGQKLLITEEKMADALNHLQIEMDCSARSEPIDQFIDNSNVNNDNNNYNDVCYDNVFDDEDSDDSDIERNSSNEQDSIYFTEELKKRLKEFEMYDRLKLETLVKHNNMELIPYTGSKVIIEEVSELDRTITDSPPMTASSSSSSSIDTSLNSNLFTSETNQSVFGQKSDKLNPLNYYRVEEPVDYKLKENKLKRTYSELSRISIEELKNDPASANVQSKPQFYLVDEDNNESADNFYLKNKPVFASSQRSNLNIREIYDWELGAGANNVNNTSNLGFNRHYSNSDEKMDI